MHHQTSRLLDKIPGLNPLTIGKFALLGMFAAVQAGCSGGSAVEYAQVTGSVRLGSRTVTSGLVEFLPRADLGTHGPRFVGYIESDGHYTLSGPHAAAGAIPGHYTVTVMPLPELGPGSSGVVPLPTVAQREVSAGPEIPKQFAQEQTSAISVEVHEGSNRIDLDLLAFDATSPQGSAAR